MASSLSLDTYLGVAFHSDKAKTLLATIERLEGSHLDCTSLHATCLITDLYCEDSSDEANISRIATNLDHAIDELERIRRSILELKNPR